MQEKNDKQNSQGRTIPIQIYINEDEKYLLDCKVKESGLASRSALLRHLIVYGFVYDVDYSELKRMNEILGRINRNLNQIAKQMNTTGHVYDADVEEVKKIMEEIWQLQRSTLSKQPSINQ